MYPLVFNSRAIVPEVSERIYLSFAHQSGVHLTEFLRTSSLSDELHMVTDVKNRYQLASRLLARKVGTKWEVNGYGYPDWISHFPHEELCTNIIVLLIFSHTDNQPHKIIK